MEQLELRPLNAVAILVGLLVVAPTVVACVVSGGAIAGPIYGALIAGAYVWLYVRLGKRRLVVDETGLTEIGAFRTTLIRWDDVAYYTFWSTDYAGAVHRALKERSVRQFRGGLLKIVARDRRFIGVDERYADAGSGIDRALSELHPRLRERQPQDFDPFAVGANELKHTVNGARAFSEIDCLVVAGPELQVYSRGTKWTGVHMKDLTNGMLLVDVLAERQIVVKTRPGTFLPSAVADKVQDVAARNAALPSARIVDK